MSPLQRRYVCLRLCELGVVNQQSFLNGLLLANKRGFTDTHSNSIHRIETGHTFIK
jgi:hypothetical protein